MRVAQNAKISNLASLSFGDGSEKGHNNISTKMHLGTSRRTQVRLGQTTINIKFKFWVWRYKFQKITPLFIFKYI